MLADGPNLFHSQGHLWHQQRVSAFVAFPEVKRGSPGLPSSFYLTVGGEPQCSIQAINTIIHIP